MEAATEQGPMDVSTWISKTRELLQTEWGEENEMAVSELAVTSAKELERRGVSILKLQIEHVNTGLYGKVTVEFGRYHGQSDALLSSNNFGVGDIVRVLPQDQNSTEKTNHPSGVVSKVTGNRICVSFSDKYLEADALRDLQLNEGALRLDKLPNDATHQRLCRALDDLERANNHPGCYSTRVVQVLFGQSKPMQDSQYVTGGFGHPGDINRDSLKLVADAVKNANLNDSQRESIDFCLRARDIGLIHGPPGTGKTTTVVDLISKAAQLGNRVLVCAPSNVAVDNIVVRLANHVAKTTRDAKKSKNRSDVEFPKVQMVRLGHPARLLPQVLVHSLDALVHQSDEKSLANDAREDLEKVLAVLYGGKDDAKPKKSSKMPRKLNYRQLRQDVKDLRAEVKKRERNAVAELLRKCNVVLATNVGAASLHKFVRPSAKEVPDEAPFDMVIIDEAAQAIEASCWIPILLGKRVVLVGDHKQLPPTIKSEEASRNGLGLTLFDRVTQMYGDSVTRLLDTQYRMNSTIMEWASKELYGGRLKAFPAIASHTLSDLPEFDGSRVGEEGSEEQELATNVLVLMDTAGCDLLETVDESDSVFVGSRANMGEALLVQKHVERLVKCGLPGEEIAVVTPYNAQVQLIKSLLVESFPKVEVRSVDGFQGQEKQAIVLSLVRSNLKGQVGFLADERRMNVAITRAKRQVFLVCNSDTVQSTSGSFLSRMIEYFEAHAWLTSPESQVTNAVMVSVPPPTLKGKDTPGAATKNVPSAMVSDTRIAELKQTLLELKAKANGSHEVSFEFSANLSSAERRIVHELCEEIDIHHESRGEGTSRFIRVTVVKMASEQCKTAVEPKSPQGVVQVVSSGNNMFEAMMSPTDDEDDSGDDESISQAKEAVLANKEEGVAVVVNTRDSSSDPVTVPDDGGRNGKLDMVGSHSQSVPKGSPESNANQASSVTSGIPNNQGVVGRREEGMHTKPVSKEIQDLRAIQAARYLAAKEKKEAEDLRKAKEWVDVSPPKSGTNSTGGNSKSKKKKKKKKKQVESGPVTSTEEILKKPAAGGALDDEVDDEMALLDSLLSVAGKCAYFDHRTSKSCKQSTKLMGIDCKHCKERFCFKHGQPEVHGCGATAGKHSNLAHREQASIKQHKPLKGQNRSYVKKQLADKISGSAEGRMSKAALDANAKKGKTKKKR